MFMLPGRKLIISLADGAALSGVSRWSFGALRLRDVECTNPGRDPVEVRGRVIVPKTAILTVQVVG